MTDSVSHRGPDNGGMWSDANVGLGHRMLWTTPESLREEPPLRDESGNLAITADARIDNREELITALDLSDQPHEEISDSDLILGAYKAWGRRCPQKLLGDFAFAIWDRRGQTMFCARDYFGIKPFYYHQSTRALVFASEIKALLSVAQVPRRLNETRVADCLALNIEDKTATFYRDIFRLPPGHTMTADRNTAVVRPFWELDPSFELRLKSDEEYAEAFHELFTEAVRCRLRSAFPVGSDLSGGIDSSSVACVARDLLAVEGQGRRLHTFSAVFDEVPESNELAFIDAVIDQDGALEPHKVQADRLSPLMDLKRCLWYTDEPITLSPSLDRGLYDAACQQGIRVYLTGHDGDTVVQKGEFYVLELALGWRWRKLAVEINGLARQLGLSRRRVLRLVLKQLVPSFVPRAWRTLLGRRELLGPATSTYIDPDFARDIGLEERTSIQRDPPESTPFARAAHWRGLVSGAQSYNFDVLDKVGAAFGIEPRHPFYDRRLVEFCLASPPEQQLSGGLNRAILRRAMANSLPKKIRQRTSKGNLAHHYIWSLRTFDRDLLQEVILDDPEVVEKYVDVTAMRGMYYRLMSGDAAPWEAAALANTVKLSVWLRSTGITP